MVQTKISRSNDQAQFLDQYAARGYPDRSSLVREAIQRLRKDLAQERLRESAQLYAESYAEDEDLQQLTQQALEGWPE